MSAAESPCLGCQRLESDEGLVQLVCGRTVCNYCPAWREETRIRHERVIRILKIPDKEDRQLFVAGVERTEGAESAARLRAAVLAEWEQRRARRAAEASA